jgi:hypothetical protein
VRWLAVKNKSPEMTFVISGRKTLTRYHPIQPEIPALSLQQGFGL